MRILEIGSKNRIFYKRKQYNDDDKVVAVFQEVEYEMSLSSFGSGYYECYIEPKELGEYLLEIKVNGAVMAEEIIRVSVVRPENTYRLL